MDGLLDNYLLTRRRARIQTRPLWTRSKTCTSDLADQQAESWQSSSWVLFPSFNLLFNLIFCNTLNLIQQRNHLKRSAKFPLHRNQQLQRRRNRKSKPRSFYLYRRLLPRRPRKSSNPKKSSSRKARLKRRLNFRLRRRKSPQRKPSKLWSLRSKLWSLRRRERNSSLSWRRRKSLKFPRRKFSPIPNRRFLLRSTRPSPDPKLPSNNRKLQVSSSRTASLLHRPQQPQKSLATAACLATTSSPRQ